METNTMYGHDVEFAGRRRRPSRRARPSSTAAVRRKPLERILVVDDDPDVHELVAVVMDRLAGISVDVCESSPDAVAAALRSKPDLILLDVMMPHQDGVQVLRALRTNDATAEIPVVFMTARPRSGEAWESAGALGVITKPFEAMELPRLIREMWDRRG